MLEIKNLTKIYRSKTGESVKALDNVSISFPETGMVFILGKSGSGKSTLLNVMGGLDSYDNGEFIIKGKSSKDFAGSDFDAYRNTFIGFIFQEYNVLDDFTVGANIGLALELQGKKATDEKINDILRQVDLLSYAKRKPNELSGGQKQRVAIARALVKDPQIIMADEPTGALDSNTGKQIFDTLKELSREKLVLIVSHDRDFAERYADRIVELSDGKIFSDVTKHERHSVQLSEGIQQINDRILRIKGGYRLTENDLKMINDYLQHNPHDIILSGDGRINDELRSAAGISAEGHTSVFESTAERDVTLKSYDKKDSKFIRSSLPIKNALRMGVSGLKHKKFRLVMTILLSLIAFALFGFADTLGAYEKETAAVSSVMDSGIKSASVRLGVKHTYVYEGEEPWSYYSYAPMNDDDIEYLRQETGMDFVPVFTGGDEWSGGFPLSSQFKSYSNNSEIYTGRLTGLVSMSEDQLSGAELRLITGKLPSQEGEIALTELMVRQFNEYGFINHSFGEEIEAGSVTADKLIGMHVTPSNNYMINNGTTVSYEIVGIVDTGFDYERYASLLPTTDDRPATTDQNSLAMMVLANEIRSELAYGFHALGFAHKDDIDALAAIYEKSTENFAQYMNGYDSETYIILPYETTTGGPDKETMDTVMNEIHFRQLAGSDAIKKMDVIWLTADGVPLTALKENQVLISRQAYESLMKHQITVEIDVAALEAQIIAVVGEDQWAESAHLSNYYDRIEYLNNSTCQSLVAKYVAELLDLPFDASMPAFLKRNLCSLLRSTTLEMPTIPLDQSNVNDYLLSYFLVEDIWANNLEEDNDFLAACLAYRGIGNLEDWNINFPSDEAKMEQLSLFYRDYLFGEGNQNNRFSQLSYDALQKMISVEKGSLFITDLSEVTLKRIERSFQNDTVATIEEYDIEIVGYFISDQYSDLIISDKLLADYQEWFAEQSEKFGSSYKETVAEHEDGIWGFAIAPMGDEAALRKIVQMTYDEESDLNFSLKNSVMETLGSFNDFIEVGAMVFLYVGIGFAVFSALLLMNFISTSISYKKREIGILRAVGAKSSDVFKIFFSEALVIALINFVLSLAAVITAISITNSMMRSEGINITLLTFGVRQVILMLVISVAVALIASFLPVYNIAKRKPVDAIKDR
ncbi:MAG: ABC transporter ATP-binding protein/permease [Clostridia bacterium]|nr:ABC transporter ATP-binding protein/permease [Clostridia bacterium]